MKPPMMIEMGKNKTTARLKQATTTKIGNQKKKKSGGGDGRWKRVSPEDIVD